MKTLEYHYKSRTEFSDLKDAYVVDVEVEQVADNAFEVTVQGAKSVPVSHDKDFNIPLYAFLPTFDEEQSVYAESLEALFEHVKEIQTKALEEMEALKLDAPS